MCGGAPERAPAHTFVLPGRTIQPRTGVPAWPRPHFERSGFIDDTCCPLSRHPVRGPAGRDARRAGTVAASAPSAATLTIQNGSCSGAPGNHRLGRHRVRAGRRHRDRDRAGEYRTHWYAPGRSARRSRTCTPSRGRAAHLHRRACRDRERRLDRARLQDRGLRERGEHRRHRDVHRQRASPWPRRPAWP